MLAHGGLIGASGASGGSSSVTASFVASAGNLATSSGTSLAASATLNVAAGDILLVVAGWEDGTSTISIGDGGSNSATMRATVNESTHNYQAMGYVLNAAANSSATFTATFGTSRGYRYLAVMQFRPSSAGQAAYDTSSAAGTGTGVNITTPSISTGLANAIVIAATKVYDSGTFESQAIGGSAAGYTYTPGTATHQIGGAWASIYTSTQSNISGAATAGAATYVSQIMSVKLGS